MAAAPGITTSGQPPTAVVQVQPGMNVQPVVLVDQNGQYITAPSSVMTTLGDTLYENAAPAPARLAGNTTATKNFLTQAGTGTVSAAPAWGTIASGDIPASVALTGTPTAPTGTPGDASAQIATDAFVAAAVSAAVQGLAVKPSVQETTAAALPSSIYSNGASGVGATLTAVTAGVLTVDGIAVALNDRVLVKNEAAPANNGIYTCTVAGAAGAAYVLTRATDMNTAAQVPGAFAFTEQGTVNAGAGFTVAGAGPYTIGTTAVNWTQFSGAGEITAGTGLSKSGNTLNNTGVLSVTATDTSVVVAGTVTAPAVATGTLDVIAAQHPPAADWSNNSHKITSLANGSGAQDAAAFGQILAKQAATAVAGYTLVNSTGTVISWTTPNDGAQHRAEVFLALSVTSNQTGGAIQVNWTPPSGPAGSYGPYAGSLTAASRGANTQTLIVGANTVVSVAQQTSQSAGAAVLWAEIWGS